ncbi:MAG: hypothetical protein WA993_08440 [Candidatus Binatus sp.]
MDRGSDNHGVGIRRRLYSRGYVRRIAEDFRVTAPTRADHDVAGIDPDANREFGMVAWSGAATEPADRFNYGESRARGAFGVVVVRHWPSEIRHNAVAEVLRDVAAETLDRFRHCAEIFGFDLTPFLWIEPCGNRGRAD